MSSNNYGMLLHEQDMKLHRGYFKEMAKLLGIKSIYRAPMNDKHWTTYEEIESNYYPAEEVMVICEEHPNQYSMKKLGWVAELQENALLISVPYDLHDLQVGALFIIPSGIDNSQGRLFRVSRMSSIMIYPWAVTCEIVPEYENTYSPSLDDYSHSSFNLLNDEEE